MESNQWEDDWVFDVDELTATHKSGLTVSLKPQDGESVLSGGVVTSDIPDSIDWQSDPLSLAELMRQAGDGMCAALSKQKRH